MRSYLPWLRLRYGVYFLAGRPPWIALALAFLLAVYGLLRKIVKVESLPGLATETLGLAPFAAAYLLWCGSAGSAADLRRRRLAAVEQSALG